MPDRTKEGALYWRDLGDGAEICVYVLCTVPQSCPNCRNMRLVSGGNGTTTSGS